jgi:hypothetical protein
MSRRSRHARNEPGSIGRRGNHSLKNPAHFEELNYSSSATMRPRRYRSKAPGDLKCWGNRLPHAASRSSVAEL